MGGRVERFEDQIARQKARSLVRSTYTVVSRDAFRKDYDLQRQIRRAVVSIMANIAEGFERARPREFHQFMSIAKGSCAEVRSHLYVAFDAGLITEHDLNSLMAQATEVGRIIGGLRASIQQRLDS